MTGNENASLPARHLQGRADRRDQLPPYDNTSSMGLQLLNARSGIPVQMTGKQMTWLIHLCRRVSQKRLDGILQRLGFSGPLTYLGRAEAGRLPAELRRARGRR